MGKGTLGEVLDGSESFGEVQDGLETLGEVRDGSGDPRGDPGRVRGPSKRSWTGRSLLGRSGTGRGTIAEVRDGLADT